MSNATAKDEKAACRIITPEALLSYPHLFTPQMPPADAGEAEKKPEYSVALVFLKGTDLAPMKQAAIAAAKAKFGDQKAVEMIRANKLRMPFRNGEEKDYPEGSTFFNARSKEKPGIVSRYVDPDTGKAAAITDPAKVYPGVYARASITFYGYDTKGNKGVAVGLNNVQILKDGPRLDNRKAAADEFDADLNETPAALDDVTGMV